jgi:hypothetical protein
MIDKITSSMVAWNETQQGYPDHWAKVHGNLVCASEEIDDEKLKKELFAEAEHYYKMKKEGKEYRPPFEKLSCAVLNHEACREIIKDSDVINGMLCYNCASKHISEAKVSQDRGFSLENFMSVIGNLSHASNHLVEEDVELANIIRQERTLFYNSVVEGWGNGGEIHKIDFSLFADRVLELAKENK